MPTGLQALNAVESATTALLNVAELARSVPPGAKAASARQQTNALAAKLLELQQAAQRQFAATIRAPWPVPSAQTLWTWVVNVRRAGNLQAQLASVMVPDALVQASTRFQEWTGALARWIQTAPETGPQMQTPVMQPQAAMRPQVGFGAAGGVPVGMPSPGGGFSPDAVQRAMGWGAIAWGAWRAVDTYRHQKKAQRQRRDSGLEIDEAETPDVIKRHGQRALDEQLSGANLALSAKPDGEYLASVRHGSKIIARASAKKPQDAAGRAVSQAIEWEDARTVDVDGDVIDPHEAPKARRREKPVEIDVTPKQQEAAAAAQE